MDFKTLLILLLSNYLYIIPFLFFFAILRSPWFKGIFGEFQVNLLIRSQLSKDNYHLFKNVTLRTEEGTTQIDHIIVSIFGVFVIETKNMKGWIYGSEKQKQWTQKIYKHSNKFQNPLHQNFKHIKTLENDLNMGADGFFSLIVFIGDSSFKTEMPDNVTYARDCINYIKSQNKVYFSAPEVDKIILTIERNKLDPGFKTNRKHVAYVNNISKNKSEQKFCPKCDSLMVLREAKKGQYQGNKFWGCSSFPKCRTTDTFIK